MTKENCFQQCISLHILIVLLSLLPENSNKHTSMPANYSFTLCDSRQSSPILLASHQTLLMCTHKGNQHANRMEIYKHQKKITGIILIMSLPLGINIKSIKHKKSDDIIFMEWDICDVLFHSVDKSSERYDEECNMYCGDVYLSI